MINKELELTIEATIHDAEARHHEYLTIEHILFAVLHDQYGIDIIASCGGDISRLRSSVMLFFEKNISKLPLEAERHPQPTIGFQRVLQRALAHIKSAGKPEVDAGDLLASIFLEEDSHAVTILEAEGLSRMDILDYISHGGAGMNHDAAREKPDDAETVYNKKHAPARDPLKLFALNLNEKAAKDGIDPLVGRDLELERTIQVLCRRRKNNIIFVGEPGVGKTAIVEGLALKIHKGQVPEVLKKAQVFALDMAALLAGTKYRGDFEARLKTTMNSIEKIPDAVLFIDEIHSIVGAGATSSGSMDAANILKPLLNSGKIRCIGATTYEEYKNYFEKDRALSRRFQKLEIHEPDIEETIHILEGLKSYYEEFHGVKFTKGALKTAAELSAKYINDRHLPDKAIDVIDEAGAVLKLSPGFISKKTIGVPEIEKVIAQMAKIPPRSISSSEINRLKLLEGELQQAVFGQEAAIRSLVTAIKRARAGLGLPEKPTGAFLFIGPTGVGKTEVTKQLAAALGVKFLRFDMSEYMEKHTVARLIGAPPGYIGFEQGGLLTDAIKKNPYSVLLLDEIEKAHPDIFNILLQVMDHATLTDNNGKKADFRNVLLIMTSNAGAMNMEKNVVGFGDRDKDLQTGGRDAIKKLFTPEFRNRLDAIISFDPLSPAVMLLVVDKFIAELNSQLAPKKVILTISDEARAWLAEKGHDARNGARPLSRLIQTEIKDLLSDEILFGRLKKGGTVHVSLVEGRLFLSCS